ncbi:hypothetical protein MIR68_003686 [Amoeboaphelidium protococcarum]|nr:hypothetical protein MIR68_003686 [Amoeboaphelidium protococcarum]
MPLLNGEPYVVPHDLSKESQSQDVEEVWVIRQTKEICSDLEDYSNRAAEYRKRKWACAPTQKDSLTYEEALLSEQKAREPQTKIPRPVQKRALEMAQYHVTGRFEQLVDQIYDEVSVNFYADEVLSYECKGDPASISNSKSVNGKGNSKAGGCSTVNGNSDLNQVAMVKVIKKLDDSKYQVYNVTDDMNRPMPKQYTDNPDLITCSSNELSRERNVVSKVALRPFLKECIQRESYYGAPWIVKDEIALDFGVSLSPPAGLWDPVTKRLQKRDVSASSGGGTTKKSSSQSSPAKHKRTGSLVILLQKPKYPVEDSELPLYQKPSQHPEMQTSAVPVPNKHFRVDSEYVADVLYIWNFLFVYAKPLQLSPFTLDDFEQSLLFSSTLKLKQQHDAVTRSSSSQIPPILVAAFVTLLRFAARHSAQVHAKLEKLSKQLPKHKIVSMQKKSKGRLLEAAVNEIQISDQMLIDDGDDSAEDDVDLDQEYDEDLDVDSTEGDQELGDNVNKASSQSITDDTATSDDASIDHAQTGIEISKQWWRMSLTSSTWMEVLATYLATTATIVHLPCLSSVLSKISAQNVLIDPTTGKALLQSALSFPKSSGSFGGDSQISQRFSQIDLSEMLALFKFVINESVICSKAIRDYMSQCTSALPELRRDKREVEARKRELESSQKELVQKKNDTTTQSQESTSATVPADVVGGSKNKKSGKQSSLQANDDQDRMDIDGNESSQSIADDSDVDDIDVAIESSDNEEEDDDDVDDELGDEYSEYDYVIQELERKLADLDKDGRANRQEKMKLQQQLKEAEEAKKKLQVQQARAEARARSQQKRQDAEQKRQLDQELIKIHRKDLQLDREIRIHSGASKGKLLGYDRFWNKYWWMDGFGSGAGAVSEFGVPQGPGHKANGIIPYGSGRLLVQGAGRVEYLGLISGANALMSRKRKPVEFNAKDQQLTGWQVDAFVTLPNGYKNKRPGDALGSNNWLQDDEWAYYETVDQVDELLCWLNPKGVRESQLKTTLTKYYDHIAYNLTKRQEVILMVQEQQGSSSLSTQESTAIGKKRASASIIGKNSSSRLGSSSNNSKYNVHSYLRYVNKWSSQ